MSSMAGKVKAKGLFKYVSLSMPTLTETPMGQLKSIMTLCLSELGLFLLMNSDVWKFSIGFSLNGPNRAHTLAHPQCKHPHLWETGLLKCGYPVHYAKLNFC